MTLAYLASASARDTLTRESSVGTKAVPHDAVAAIHDSVLDRLRVLVSAYPGGANKNDLAVIFITACILDGVDTGTKIVTAASWLGLNHKHVALQLAKGLKPKRTLSLWRKEPDGRYTLAPG